MNLISLREGNNMYPFGKNIVPHGSWIGVKNVDYIALQQRVFEGCILRSSTFFTRKNSSLLECLQINNVFSEVCR